MRNIKTNSVDLLVPVQILINNYAEKFLLVCILVNFVFDINFDLLGAHKELSRT